MGKIRKFADFVVREAPDVPLHFLDDATGEVVEEKFTIRFRSYSQRGRDRLLEELRAEGAIDDNDVVQYSALYAKTVMAIIDSDGEALTDDKGEPATLTKEFFDQMLAEDYRAIEEGMNSDANPPKPSSLPGDSGSSPAASEG